MRVAPEVWRCLSYAACAAAAGCAGPPLTISTPELPNGAVGISYRSSLSADGAGQQSWRVSSGALPPGLGLDATTGVIAGTPMAAGAFSFAVTVTDSSWPPRAGEATFDLVILEQLTLDAALEPARVGEAYTDALEASGGVPPYAFGLIGLPAGLDFDEATGTVFGTPLNPDLEIALEVTVTDSGDPRQSQTVRTTLVVKPRPVSITTAALPDGTIDALYVQRLDAADGLPPYTWAVVAGVLPDGLRLNLATGVVSGTPTKVQTATFTIEVTDSDEPPTSDAREFVIDVRPVNGQG